MMITQSFAINNAKFHLNTRWYERQRKAMLFVTHQHLFSKTSSCQMNWKACGRETWYFNQISFEFSAARESFFQWRIWAPPQCCNGHGRPWQSYPWVSSTEPLIRGSPWTSSSFATIYRRQLPGDSWESPKKYVSSVWLKFSGGGAGVVTPSKPSPPYEQLSFTHLLF